MSAGKRILSGTAATSAGVLLGFAQRLLIIPVILSFWDATTFGHYLTLMAAIAFVGLLGRSFETILNREFLRLNKANSGKMVELYGGSLFISASIEILSVSVFLAGVFLIPDFFQFLRGDWRGLGLVAGAYLFARVFISFPGSCYSGILSCYGYYPNLAWMGLVGRILTIVAPMIGVYAGAKISGVVSIELMAPALFAPFTWIWMRRWGIASNVWRWKPNFSMAFQLFVKSLQNVFIMGVDLMRGEGLRLVMAPLAGASALTTFVTTRTGANVALQSLNTISTPVMPELMRFLGQRDQARSEAAFATVWLMLICGMVPCVIILQVIIEPLFVIWTRGKVSFDPWLFGSMSLGVLVFASAQPAMAVVQGNNLLRSQILISLTAGVTVIGGLFLILPSIGLRGAGLALLAGECIAAGAYRRVAARWLKENGLRWPKEASYRVLWSVAVGGLALAFIPLNRSFAWLVAVAALAAECLVFLSYWNRLPELARSRISTFVLSRLSTWSRRSDRFRL